MAAITTIPENDRRERFVASGGQTAFPFDFPVYQPEHIAAFRLRGTTQTELAYGADFEVTGAGDQDGGTVTLLEAAEAGDVITIKSDQPTARTTSYADGGDLKAAALNSEGNRIYIEFQELQDALNRTLRLAETDPPSDQQLPPAPLRANGVLGFDGDGRITILYPDLTGDLSASFAQLLITNALNQAIPPGSIMQWAGSLSAIPATWALCDGTNGTPDLRDKFIVAAGPTKPANSTGGSASGTTGDAGGHDHGGQTQDTALTVAQMPPHTHDYQTQVIGASANFIAGAVAIGPQTNQTGSAGLGEGHRHGITGVGNHTHSVTVNPPYYALAFIMRTGFFVPPPDPGGPAELSDAALFRAERFACGDETTSIIVATGLIEVPALDDMATRKVKVFLRTASSSGDVEVNVRINGTAITATAITIPASQKIATVTDLALASIAEDDLITVDVVAAGTGAAGLKVAIEGVAA